MPSQKCLREVNSIEIFFASVMKIVNALWFVFFFFPFSVVQRAHKYKQAIEYEEIRKAASSSPTHCEANQELLLQNNTIFPLCASEQFIFSV